MTRGSGAAIRGTTMNTCFISAGILLLIAFPIHLLFGNRDYSRLDPQSNGLELPTLHRIWMMGRCCFHMVSVDLLLSAVFLLLLGTQVIPYNFYLALLVLLLYVGYLGAWLATLYVSRVKPVLYLHLGQWMLFVVAFVLILIGMKEGGLPV